ncbi:MAG: type II and III secretion system protein family protein [Xanthobacteraceae bacterium]|nr:type II and III secretion system protein family protein [Xanthobacteraceae bacterium]
MRQALCFAATGALLLEPALTPAALAAERPVFATARVSAPQTTRNLTIGAGKSIVIDLPRDAKDVLVANPKIATAVMRSSRRAYVIAVANGTTNILFFDADGQQIVGYEVSVAQDVGVIRAAINQAIPGSNVNVQAIGNGIMLTGSVASQAESQQAYEIASRFIESSASFSSTYNSTADGANAAVNGQGQINVNTDGKGGAAANRIVNAITVRGRDQVMLKVVVAEVQRNVLKQLGVDLSASMSYGSTVLNFNNQNPFSITGKALVPDNQLSGTFGGTGANVQATLRAMESAGVMRTLAEPNLTAISGESANFLAGGEFPISTGGSISNGVYTPTVTFKQFGVSLNFTPVVLSGGRISLHVRTEVSELSQDGALTTTTGTVTTTIPSLKTRRADTTLEIPSGGSMAMAGLIQQQTKQAINGLPGLTRLPVLGALFRSRDFANNNTELMVLVTPYIVRAVAQKDLSRPDDGFVASSDPQAVLLGSINRIYGVPGRNPADRKYRGAYGFITD